MPMGKADPDVQDVRFFLFPSMAEGCFMLACVILPQPQPR